MREINKIIVHCTATPYTMVVTAKMVDAWHRERGWSGIGYHYLVLLDGTVEVGRPEWKIGSHCKGYNGHSIGIAYAGGLDASGHSADTRTPGQKEALRKLIARLREKYGPIPVYGHSDFAEKDCPCFDAFEEYRLM